eukprot:symbB.v1.2.015504.t1/scaffold1160.1/size134679/13
MLPKAKWAFWESAAETSCKDAYHPVTKPMVWLNWRHFGNILMHPMTESFMRGSSEQELAGCASHAVP